MSRAGWSSARSAPHDAPSGFTVLLATRPLLIFAAAAVLFHFANAAMLPLVGQKLALVNKEVGTSLMAVCIVAAQTVMVPVAMLVGARADTWGRKPIFLTGFAILALRGFFYPLSDNAFWLVGVQLLDGVGAGIFGALFPVIVDDLTTRHGSVQRKPGCHRDRAGHRSGAVDGGRGADRGEGRLWSGVRHARRHRGCRIRGLSVGDAGDQTR